MTTKPKTKSKRKGKALGKLQEAVLDCCSQIHFNKRRTHDYLFAYTFNGKSHLKIKGQFDDDQTRSLIAHLQAWLDTGSLELK